SQTDIVGNHSVMASAGAPDLASTVTSIFAKCSRHRPRWRAAPFAKLERFRGGLPPEYAGSTPPLPNAARARFFLGRRVIASLGSRHYQALALDLLTEHPAERSSTSGEARRLPPSALRRLVQEHYD